MLLMVLPRQAILRTTTPFGRQPPLDDNPLWTTTTLDDNPFGRQPPLDDNPLGRQDQQHRRISNSGLYEQACLLMDAQL
jgi:hypothetical protein